VATQPKPTQPNTGPGKPGGTPHDQPSEPPQHDLRPSSRSHTDRGHDPSSRQAEKLPEYGGHRPRRYAPNLIHTPRTHGNPSWLIYAKAFRDARVPAAHIFWTRPNGGPGTRGRSFNAITEKVEQADTTAPRTVSPGPFASGPPHLNPRKLSITALEGRTMNAPGTCTQTPGQRKAVAVMDEDGANLPRSRFS